MAGKRETAKHEMVRAMMGLVPPDWDKSALVLAQEISAMLKNIVDEGTAIDSGGGDGSADLWATVDGKEYFINVRKSNGQLKKEGVPEGDWYTPATRSLYARADAAEALLENATAIIKQLAATLNNARVLMDDAEARKIAAKMVQVANNCVAGLEARSHR